MTFPVGKYEEVLTVSNRLLQVFVTEVKKWEALEADVGHKMKFKPIGTKSFWWIGINVKDNTMLVKPTPFKDKPSPEQKKLGIFKWYPLVQMEEGKISQSKLTMQLQIVAMDVLEVRETNPNFKQTEVEEDERTN